MSLARKLTNDVLPVSKSLLENGVSSSGSANTYLVPQCALSMAPSMPEGSLMKRVLGHPFSSDPRGAVDGLALGIFTASDYSSSSDEQRSVMRSATQSQQRWANPGRDSGDRRFWIQNARALAAELDTPWMMAAPPWALNEVRCDEKAG